MTTLDVLRRARALIERPEAWGKVPTMRVGQKCFVTAVVSACWFKKQHFDSRALRLTLRLVESVGAFPTGRIPDWNDAPERTHADVMELFEKAIAAEEAKTT